MNEFRYDKQMPAIHCLFEIQHANLDRDYQKSLPRHISRLFQHKTPSQRECTGRKFIGDIMRIPTESLKEDTFSDSSDDPGMSLEEDIPHYNISRQSSAMTINVNDMDHIVAQKEEVVVSSTNGEMVVIQSGDDPTLLHPSSVSSQSSTTSQTSRPLAHLSVVNYDTKSNPCNCFQLVSNYRNDYFVKDHCFTRYQATEYWIQKGIIASRGEGANLMSHLLCHRIVRYRWSFIGVSLIDLYNRRFRESTLRIIPLEEIFVWEEPEYCIFDHDRFVAEYNFSFLFFLFSTLLKHEHTAVCINRGNDH